MNGEADVRRATFQDAEAIANVHARSWRVTYDGLLPPQLIADVVAGRKRRAGRFRELLADGSADRRVWVAARKAGVVGFAVWGPSHDDDADERTADLEALYLDPDAIGRGIGRELIDRVQVDMIDAGFSRATLWVLETNERARHFYESRGWSADGARKIEERPSGVLIDVRYQRTLVGSRQIG